MSGRALAIITARGGSKRIPRKNVKAFAGRPILAYSIAAARESGVFDEVMVSTDDAEIRDLALSLGASVPFMRSTATSNDFATTAEVLLEVLGAYADRDEVFDYACGIYPTAPFLTGERLREAYTALTEKEVDSVIPVARFGFPIWRSLKINDGLIAFNWPEFALTRSQDLPAAYHDAGQFYFLRVPAFLAQRSLVMRRTASVILPEHAVQDIDTEDDWTLAEIKFEMQQRRMSAADR